MNIDIFSETDRILLIRLRALGDVVLTTPAIRTVRQNFPKAHIAMLVNRPYVPIHAENPHLDEVIPFDRPPKGKKFFSTTNLTLKLAKTLRSREFDLTIDFHSSFRTGLLTGLSGAKYRIGFDGIDGIFNNIKVHRNSHADRRHNIDAYLDLLRAVGIPAKDRTLEMFLTESDKKFVREKFAKIGLKPDRKKVAIFPGAAWELRRWMPERFAELADRINRKLNAQILIFGGSAEIGLVNSIAKMMTTKATIFAGDLQLGQLAAMIDKCHLFISNDTGPMHLATALHTPTIALFGPGNHTHFQPLDPRHTAIYHHLPCTPCKQFRVDCQNNICMKSIGVDEVWKAVFDTLNSLDKKNVE